MQSTTPLFQQAVAGPHRIEVRADVYYNGAVLAADLPIADGSVTIDRGSSVRRTLSLTIADPSYLPWNASDPLAVYGQRIQVSYGIVLGGVTESIPLGTFRINEPQGDTIFGPVTLTGQSSEVDIQDDVFQVPTSTRGYGGCVDAISALIHQTLPNATVVNLTSDGRNPSCAVATFDAQASRWDAVTQIATAMQAEIFVDALDRFVITDIPNVLAGSVVWSVADDEGGTLMAASRQMSRTAVYNAVVVTGENSSTAAPPVYAIAKDVDPASPTRWGGPYGKVTKFVSNPLLTTSGGCQAVANSLLFDATAPNVQTTVQNSVNPAIEAGDVGRVTDGLRKELFIAQSVTIPLTPDGAGALTLRGGKDDSS